MAKKMEGRNINLRCVLVVLLKVWPIEESYKILVTIALCEPSNNMVKLTNWLAKTILGYGIHREAVECIRCIDYIAGFGQSQELVAHLLYQYKNLWLVA